MTKRDTRKLKLQYQLLLTVVVLSACLITIRLLYITAAGVHHLPLAYPPADVIYKIPGDFWGIVLIFFFAMCALLLSYLSIRIFIHRRAKRESWSPKELQNALNGKRYPPHWYYD